MSIHKHIKDATIGTHHPKSWGEAIDLADTTVLNFRNKQHFVNAMSDLTQKKDTSCGVTYAQALSDLKAGVGTIALADYKIIKHKVKESLLKRKLISENIYKGFEYATEGELIDIARYVEGNPECAIVPKESGKKHFYELYINVSVNSNISNEIMSERIAQILATIELLEQERIYIKVNVVDTTRNGNTGEGKPHLICILPVFSHRDTKCISSLSSVVNERFLRKFNFAIAESLWGDDLAYGYGKAFALPNCINISEPFDEVSTVESILDQLVTKCTKR